MAVEKIRKCERVSIGLNDRSRVLYQVQGDKVGIDMALVDR